MFAFNPFAKPDNRDRQSSIKSFTRWNGKCSPVETRVWKDSRSRFWFLKVIQLLLTPRATRSQHLSYFLSLVLFLNLVLDTSRLRTFILVGHDSTSALFLGAFIAQFACRAISLITFNLPLSFTKAEFGKGTPENAGFVSQLFVLWAYPLMWVGKRGDLELDDLPELQEEMASQQLYQQFEALWGAERYGSSWRHH